MRAQLRWAGAGMALGGVLFFARMAPIFAVLPDDMAFPPATTEDLARLAAEAGMLWPLSHVMGLVAVTLFVFGYWAHARALANAGHRVTATLAAAAATAGFGAFAVALAVDGFFVPQAAHAFLAGGLTAPGLDDVAVAHRKALFFFTPGVFSMFVAMGFLSSRLLHGFVHSRWLGGAGMLVAVLGPSAYLSGLAGPDWDNLQIGGSLMMLAFLWHLLVGLAALFGRGVRVESGNDRDQ